MARTAIRTYQEGGYVNPYLAGLPGQAPLPDVPPPQPQPPEVTGQVTPQQAPAGAGGQAPPPAAPPPPPSTAIQTQPQQPEFDHDKDWDASENDESQKLSILRSHRGDNAFISGIPAPLDPKQNPEWQKAEEVNALIPKMTNKKMITDSQKYVKSTTDRILRETQHQNDAAIREFHNKEKAELSRADAVPLDTSKQGAVHTEAKGIFDQEALRYDENAKNGKTVQDQQEAEERKRASPIVTLAKPGQREQIVRRLVQLNRDILSGEDGARLLMEIATPPRAGQKGQNGYTGRGAANYGYGGKDAVGNVGLVTSMGYIRVPKDVYQTIKNARIEGYNNALKYRTDLQKQREEEAKPGWWSRNVTEPVMKAIQ